MFIYYNLKFYVTCKNMDFEYQQIRTPTNLPNSKNKTKKHRNHQKFQTNVTFAILPKSKNTQTKQSFGVLWNLLLLMKPSDAIQNCPFQHKKAKS